MNDLDTASIAAGDFLMGSPASEPGRRPDEGPQHKAEISQLGCMRYPVTRRLYASVMGVDLHAGVRCGAHQRQELERLCRYITRPAIANERLSRNGKGQVLLQLKSPWRDGTTHIVMTPLEFMQRLAALVP